MPIKKILGTIHLWLGLTSGLVVFILAVTGCIYAFQSEIQNLTQPYRFVEQQDKSFRPPSALKAIAEGLLPKKHIHAVLYRGTNEAAQVIFYNIEPDYYYYLVYLNPYNGEVLKVKDMETDFFQFILQGHFYIWLPPSIGQPIVATATLIFVIMLITGIILWWPKNTAAAKQRFTIRWNGRWGRKNYDLHNVFGFYVLSSALVLALTGLVWGFQWFAEAWHKTAGGEKSLAYEEPVSDTAALTNMDAPAIDKVWYKMKEEYKNAKSIEVHIPTTETSPVASNANPDGSTYWQTDYRYFDQYTLKEQSVSHIYGRFGNASNADKLFRMNYDIHTGAVIGLPGKMLMFFASFICASLPVTGIMIWWGRRMKKGKVKTHEKMHVSTEVEEELVSS